MTISSLSCDATTGKPRWFTDTIGAYNGESPLIANGVVYVCAISLSQSWVYALDAATGRTLGLSSFFRPDFHLTSGGGWGGLRRYREYGLYGVCLSLA